MSARAVCFVAVVAIEIAAAPHALALDSHRRVTQYAQTHFAARDGMPHGVASAIAQTSDGYLWAASQEGLSSVLFKPFQVERLVDEVKKAVGGVGVATGG